MTDPEIRQLADAATGILRPYLDRSEPLRQLVSLIGKWLSEEASRPVASAQMEGKPTESSARSLTNPVVADRPLPQPTETVVVASAPAPSPCTIVPHTARPTLPISSAKVPLKIGDAVAHVKLSGTTEELGRARRSAIELKPEAEHAVANPAKHEDIDLDLIVSRCRLKAASCLLCIERRASLADPAAELETRDRMNAMIAQAKSMTRCYLAVFNRDYTQPPDAALQCIAQAYEAQADAAALMLRVDAPASRATEPDIIKAMSLLAEANSALRVALADAWFNDDRDQNDAHVWLRQQTSSRQVFIDRFMSMSNPADPALSADLRRRARELGERLDQRAEQDKAIKSALNQIRYHAAQAVKHNADAPANDWARIAEAITRLNSLGVSPADRRIAQAIGAEAAALCPADSRKDRSVATAVSMALAASHAGGAADAETRAAPREWSSAVLQVREHLRGKRLVIIGGERNAEAVDRFVDAFQLADAEWVPLVEHGPATPMRAPISRPDTAAVVVIIKLAGHRHVDEARAFSREAAKPCVMLTGGYNPEQVANAILVQASERLKP